MSDIIKLLPDSVANQIAAGEVIQRPASVIKELVENSVDAGAGDIRIIIKDAGRTLIQVIDNGRGMTPTDARMAFERHATSKIRHADDLFTLHTMGFRGEALPSICAISQVEMRTNTADSQIGTRLLINATKVETQESAVCEKGTNIMVKNLFFNVPARRKFLKSDNVELSNIMREFERLALVNNNVRMSIDTGLRHIDLKPATFRQRIEDLWKNTLDTHLIPLEVDTALVKISGYISRPEFARRRNPLQYLIVNGRNMRHPYFHKAIVGCYETLIATDTQPNYFLKFEVNPDTIDVNIHPTKNEIKFEYEQDIWPILQAAVKAALGKHGAVPSINFDIDVVPVAPLEKGKSPLEPKIDVPRDYNPFAGTVIGNPGNHSVGKNDYSKTSKNYDWDKLYSEFKQGARGFSPDSVEEKAKGEGNELNLEIDNGNICFQYAERYIITSAKSGLYIIDQRRAHVKILYEEYFSHFQSEQHSSQGLMFPDSIEVDVSQQTAFEEVMPKLNAVGFRFEYDSETRWNIVGVPSFAKNLDYRDIILKMIESVDESGVNYGREGERQDMLLSDLALAMARGAAINYGRKLSMDEMEHIAGKLFSLPDPLYTPNGNKIFQLIDEQTITGFFK